MLDDADVPQAQSLVDVALELVRHTLGPHGDDGEATLYGLGCQHGAGRDRVDDDEDVAVGRCAACGDPLDRVGHSISHRHWTGLKVVRGRPAAQNRGCRRIVIRRKASETCDETGMSLRYMLLALDPCL